MVPEAEEVMREVAGLCRRFSARQVYLYGSRAKGTHLKRSDIDIAVSGVRDFAALEEAVDGLPTLYKIDLLNLDTCSNQDLLEDIRLYGREI